MDKDIRSRNYIVDKLMKESGERDSKLKDALAKIADLENKSCDHEDRLFSQNTDIESMKMNFQLFQRGVDGMKEKVNEHDKWGDRLDQCEKDIAELKETASRPVISGGDGVGEDALADMLDNLKKHFHTLFVPRDEFAKLEERVKKLEDDYTNLDNTVKENGEKLDSTSDLANNNKEEIEKLKKLLDEKVDADAFDQAIQNLNSAIASAGGEVKAIPSPSGNNISTKDMNKIKDMLEKFPDFVKKLDDIYKEIDGKADRSELKKLSDELAALRDLLNSLAKDIDFLKASNTGGGDNTGQVGGDVVIQITNKIEKLEIKLGNLENEIGGLRRAAFQTVSMPAPPVADSKPIDTGKLDELERRLDGLDDDFKRFNSELVKEIKNHQDQINGKADYAQLEELKDFLLSKIDDLVRGFKQFADKNDTKKALKNLEKQLKNLYDLVMSRLQGSDEDDAMFSKKPLGGFSCAS